MSYWHPFIHTELSDADVDRLLDLRRRLATESQTDKAARKTLRATRLVCGLLVNEPPGDCPFIPIRLWPPELWPEIDAAMESLR